MKRIKLLSVMVALFGFVIISSAQTLQEVTEARNKGAELMAAGDLDGAITELEKCIELAIAVGDDAEEHRVLAESALPNLYLQRASRVPRTDFPALLAALNEVVEVAQKYNDSRVKESAERQIPQIYLALGNTAYAAREYEEAIKNLEEATARDPNLVTAYFIKGVCYQSLNNEEKMEENYKQAIEKGTAAGDVQNVQRARQQLRNFHYNAGINSRRAQRWDDAIASFLKATEADENYFDGFYALASSYNSRRNWDDAIAAAERALQIRSTEVDAVYFELGTAYAGKNDRTRACENFRRVTSGPFLEGAKYQIETALRCN